MLQHHGGWVHGTNDLNLAFLVPFKDKVRCGSQRRTVQGVRVVVAHPLLCARCSVCRLLAHRVWSILPFGVNSRWPT